MVRDLLEMMGHRIEHPLQGAEAVSCGIVVRTAAGGQVISR
jgi:hypothetical protein